MPQYALFGGCLRSEIALPELRPAAETGETWTLRVVSAEPPPLTGPMQPLGSEPVIPGVTVRLQQTAASYRMTYEDTGAFDISPDGRTILWWKPAGARLEAARLDIVNRVLPVALHLSGMLCLHGSAVSIDGRAIAFLAPRHFGKSTLAMALTDLGGRIVTDDALALELGPPVWARPGIHSVRLLDDAAQAVVGSAAALAALGAYPLTRRDAPLTSDNVVTKQVLRGLPESRLMLRPVPLAAVYMLFPSLRAEAVAHRSRLPAVRAAISLVEHAKSGALLGKLEAPRLFARAVHTAQHVPVYQLSFARDLSRIADVAAVVAGWHRAPVALPA